MLWDLIESWDSPWVVVSDVHLEQIQITKAAQKKLQLPLWSSPSRKPNPAAIEYHSLADLHYRKMLFFSDLVNALKILAMQGIWYAA